MRPIDIEFRQPTYHCDDPILKFVNALLVSAELPHESFELITRIQLCMLDSLEHVDAPLQVNG